MQDKVSRDAQSVEDWDTLCGITDDELDRLFCEAVRLEIEKKRIRGLPVALYDSELKKAYLEYPDGRREYVEYNYKADEER